MHVVRNPSSALTGALVMSLAAWLVTSPHPLYGCAAVGKKGDRVEIATESALIVWQPGTKTQHFIRQASFDTSARDFGFLVPTPTRPVVAEADGTIFNRLQEWTKPEVVNETRVRWSSLFFLSKGGRLEKGELREPVRVLEQGRVGNLDYSILEADDAQELNDWLARHEYVADTSLAPWLDHYVRKHWKITAFKIAGGDGTDSIVAASAVRMSFQTDEPFFPYREPADQGEAKGRLLRVFFVGGERVQGKLGGEEAWPGRAVYAAPLTDTQGRDILETLDLPGEIPPGSGWLTVLEDDSTRRPGDADVFFTAAPDQSEVARPRIVRVNYVDIPLELIVLVAVGVLAAVVILRRRAKAQR